MRVQVDMAENARPVDRELAFAVSQRETPLAEIRELLKRGADVTIRFDPKFQDDKQMTPLHMAAKLGRAEVVELLVSHGAELEARNSRGVTPIFSAVAAGKVAAVRALAEAGADLHATSPNGTTLFHAAAAIPGNQPAALRDMARLMRAYGLNDKATNDTGKTPWNYARSSGNFRNMEAALEGAVALPRLPKNGPVTKAMLFAADENGATPLDHPETWHTMWDRLAEPLTKDDLMGKPLVRGIECGAAQKMADMLAGQGSALDAGAWIDAKGRATGALEAVVRKEQVNDLLNDRFGVPLSVQEMKQVFAALPPEGRAQAGNYHRRLAEKARNERLGAGIVRER